MIRAVDIVVKGHWPELKLGLVESRRSISWQKFWRNLRRVPDAVVTWRERTQVCGNVRVAGAAASAEVGRQPAVSRGVAGGSGNLDVSSCMHLYVAWRLAGLRHLFCPRLQGTNRLCNRHNKRASFIGRWILTIKSYGRTLDSISSS